MISAAAGVALQPVEQAFMEHTADAAAFAAYLEKMKVLGINDQEISDAQLRSIAAPTMIVTDDASSGSQRSWCRW